MRSGAGRLRVTFAFCNKLNVGRSHLLFCFQIEPSSCRQAKEKKNAPLAARVPLLSLCLIELRRAEVKITKKSANRESERQKREAVPEIAIPVGGRL